MKFLSKIFAEEIPFIFTCPALLWQVIFLYVPVAMLLLHSVFDYNITLGTYVFTKAYYAEIFSSLYIQIIIRSFFLALTSAFLCLIIAYPVAYYLAMKGSKRFKTFLLFSLIFPSWTSLIVQIYSWFFLLEKNGFVSRMLVTLGIISPSFHLLNNYFTILLGMVSCYLPFMILPIYSVLDKMNKSYLEASADLGANRFETFRRVVFPLSLPGVYAGFFLVFIPSFGEFAIPTLLGGSKFVFWGNVIVDKFLRSQDWRSGSALAIVGVMLPVLLMMLIFLCLNIVRALRMRKTRLIQQQNAREFWG